MNIIKGFVDGYLRITEQSEQYRTIETFEDCLYCSGYGELKDLNDRTVLCIACDGTKKVKTISRVKK